ncbi:MAG: CHAT domain-containing protein [Saprospiraceae bacterium]|nr:CHAT domain-containing protein [Saprospiraceae bacterium]
MKYKYRILMLLISAELSGQSTDSIVIKQVDSLILISRKLSSKNEHENALQIIGEAEKISLKYLGRKSIAYAKCCNNHARIVSRKAEYIEAEKWALESKLILEEILGKHDTEYALAVNNLGILHLEKGEFERAEPFLLEAKNIREINLGKNHRDYSQSLNNLGILYQDMGIYEKAEPLFIEALKLKEKNLEKDPLSYAKGLNNLAVLYLLLGKYENAEPYFIQTIDIRSKALGKVHIDYANGLANLALLYLKLGNFEKAEQLFIECKSIIEKTLGKAHPNYAEILNNLSVLYIEIANSEKVEAFLPEARDIWEKFLGKEHPLYASCLNNLGRFYWDSGDTVKAEVLFMESLSIKEKLLGKEHPDYAETLANLVQMKSDSWSYKKVESAYIETNSIWEKTLGKNSLEYLGNQFNLAQFYEKNKQFSKSEPLLADLINQDQKKLAKGITFLSERELLKYVSTFEKRMNSINYFLLTRHLNQEKTGILNNLCFDNALFYKGFILSSASQLNSMTKISPEAEEINLRLKAYRRRLAIEYAKPFLNRKNVNELEEMENRTEKELSIRIAGYRKIFENVSWTMIQTALKKDEICIEFISFPTPDLIKSKENQYGAILLRSDSKQALCIPLFEEKSLDSLLHSKSERKADYVNGLYTLSDRGAIAVENPKKSLYEILWKPIEKNLDGIKTIYFSPSGLLHRLNLDAIPVSETETLADRYNLIELNSTRQLVIPTQIKNVNNEAVLYGGIQFEQDSIVQNNEPLIASRSRGELSFSSVDSTLRGGSWNYLAGTEREVNSIEKIMETSGLKVNLKKGYAATEESFKNLGANNNSSPRILHIATHGYFFPDTKNNSQESQVKNQNENVFTISDHPMLRSGLIMAGGNIAWQGKQTLEGREDGILTAYEISQMNLSNTELVVLSACETGLGDIQGNEGVYGLQRAFKIAGAKYLIMSLWQVPDKQTSLLMTTFYKKWLENKMTIPDAFHAAQKELRNIGLDPYQWAGFVLVE